jgi:hypothetical protein
MDERTIRTMMFDVGDGVTGDGRKAERKQQNDGHDDNEQDDVV